MPEGRDNPAPGSGTWLRRLREWPNDSPAKMVVVTLLVCLFGSILVAGSAVLLKPAQEANKERERQAQIAEIVSRLPGVSENFQFGVSVRMEAHVVDLASGRYVSSIEAARFDQRRATRDPRQSVVIPPARDFAQLRRRSRHSVVYLIYQKDRLSLIILPIHGRGFASMLYGYLGLSGDTRTVVGLNFFEHGETPGLGALIVEPKWRAQWYGKQVWDDAGKPGLGVADRAVEKGSPQALHLVDGLTGATWTSRGVTSLLRFWLGDDGFGPYLRTIRKRGGGGR